VPCTFFDYVTKKKCRQSGSACRQKEDIPIGMQWLQKLVHVD
jgi:hypothetical protein